MNIQTKALSIDNVVGCEEWREALIAFYDREFLNERARGLRNGDPLDYLDERMIEALKAAIPLAPARLAA